MPRSRKPSPDSDRLPAPDLVRDASAFAELLTYLEGFDEIAIDTEADSFFHYQESVCLIQVTAGQRDFIVDPLADFDITGLGDVLADPQRVKVFHDGEYDVLIMKRDYGFEFAELFDTRVAAAALGSATPGLASVLNEHFGVELDKSQQRSDWSARPLSPEQLDYARLDTHYLIPLMHRMRAALDEAGRTPVVEGECRRLEALEPPDRSFDPDTFLRVKGARQLGPMGMQRMRELFIARDRIARRRDVPPFKVVGNNELLRVAESDAWTLDELRRIPRLSAKVLARVGEQMAKALERAREQGPMKRPPRLAKRDGTDGFDEAQMELHDRLKNWRKGRAIREEMDSSLVLNRFVLLELTRNMPATREDLEATAGLLPWQMEAFGDELLDCIGSFRQALESGEFQPKRRRRR